MNGVYCLTFPHGKRYVGMSVRKNGKGIERRWCIYKNVKTCKTGIGNKLRRALVKYGVDNVKFEVVLLTNDYDRAQRLEKQLIALWGLRNMNFGYNHLEGGLINYIRGKTLTNRKISTYVYSPETCEKRRLFRLGRKESEEVRRNMSLAQKRYLHKATRILTIKNIETGKTETGGVSELSRKCNISHQHLSTRGKSKGWIVIDDSMGKLQIPITLPIKRNR
jgi:group I intron endonuclease